MEDIKIIEFKLSEEEHKKRNWQQTSEELTIEQTIDFYKQFVIDSYNNWYNTNYDNYFEDMLSYTLVIKKLKDMLTRLKNLNYIAKEKIKEYKIKTFYDYNYERFVIEKQIEI